MYYKSGGAAEKASGQRAAMLSNEAAMWKSMALQKVGTIMKIPQRQFIGNHPEIKKSIERAMNHHLKDIEKNITRRLRKR